MTENKRFIYAKSEGGTGYGIYDITKNYTFPTLPREYEAKVFCKILNELYEKNETQKWVNDKISYLEKKYEFGQTEYKGCPMHNIQFGINILKELQRYLEGQEK